MHTPWQRAKAPLQLYAKKSWWVPVHTNQPFRFWGFNIAFQLLTLKGFGEFKQEYRCLFVFVPTSLILFFSFSSNSHLFLLFPSFLNTLFIGPPFLYTQRCCKNWKCRSSQKVASKLSAMSRSCQYTAPFFPYTSTSAFFPIHLSVFAMFLWCWFSVLIYWFKPLRLIGWEFSL